MNEADARSIAWMLGGTIPTDRLDLPAIDGTTVVVRSVSADDQARWRDYRKSRMMGYGALGDEGDVRARSYPNVPIPEWLLDCCTACVEVSNSAQLPPIDFETHADPKWVERIAEAAFKATRAEDLDVASNAVVDILRLVVTARFQVALTELLLVTKTDPVHTQNYQGKSTPGFLWRHAHERWELAASDVSTLLDLWRNYAEGPNRERIRWPLRRFGVASQRAFVEDRLVDRIIALEAIYTTEDDPVRGKDSRIASRANSLLGGERTERRLRTKRIVDAYGIRTDLVHGQLPPEEDIERAATATDAILRDSLRAHLAASELIDPTADRDS